MLIIGFIVITKSKSEYAYKCHAYNKTCISKMCFFTTLLGAKAVLINLVNEVTQ